MRISIVHLLNIGLVVFGAALVITAFSMPLLTWTWGVETELVANPTFSRGLDPWVFNYEGSKPFFIVRRVVHGEASLLEVSSYGGCVGEVVMSQRFKFDVSWSLLSPMFVRAVLKVNASSTGGGMVVVIKPTYGGEAVVRRVGGGVVEERVESYLWPYAGRELILELHFMDSSEEEDYTWMVREASLRLIDTQGAATTVALIVFIVVATAVGAGYAKTRL